MLDMLSCVEQYKCKTHNEHLTQEQNVCTYNLAQKHEAVYSLCERQNTHNSTLHHKQATVQHTVSEDSTVSRATLGDC